jgi:carbon-monoxide dehydrogenase large subunit
MISDAGAYTYQGINLHYNASTNFPGPYILPHYKLHVSVVETNKVPTAPVRGAGYPEGCFAMERRHRRHRARPRIDRVEARRRNLVPASAIPYATPMQARSTSAIVYESGDFPACLDLALTSADYAGFPARREKARAEGRLLGFGIASGSRAPAAVRSSRPLSGLAAPARSRSSPAPWRWGRALKTVLAQIAADQIGVRPGGHLRWSSGGHLPPSSSGSAAFASPPDGNRRHIPCIWRHAPCARRRLRRPAVLARCAGRDLDIRDGHRHRGRQELVRSRCATSPIRLAARRLQDAGRAGAGSRNPR